MAGSGLEAVIRVSLGPVFTGQVHGEEAGLSKAKPGGQNAAQDQGGRRLSAGVAARWLLRDSDVNKMTLNSAS